MRADRDTFTNQSIESNDASIPAIDYHKQIKNISLV